MIIEILLILLAVLIFISFVTAGFAISKYNLFVSLKEDINTQWSNIKTEYQRRVDLFYNLIQTVKSFKKHERTTLKEVVEARSAGFSGSSKKADSKTMKSLDGMFSKLLAIFERYPDLKSNEQHNKLMDEIRITEDRVNVSRTDYNNVVRSYNVNIRTFPSRIIAKMFSFKIEQFFKSQTADIETAPKIELD